MHIREKVEITNAIVVPNKAGNPPVDTLRFRMQWSYSFGNSINVRMWLIGPAFPGGNYYIGGGSVGTIYEHVLVNPAIGTYYLVPQVQPLTFGYTSLQYVLRIYRNGVLADYLSDGTGYGYLPPGVWVPTEPYDMFVRHDLDTALIEVRQPSPTVLTDSITAQPAMPNLEVKTRLKNHTGGSAQFDFRYEQWWINTAEVPDRKIHDTFTGIASVQNSDLCTWTIPWGAKIRGGNRDTLFISATTAHGGMYEKKIVNPYKITGQNPTIAEVKAGLTLQQQVVIYKESVPKWKHFRSTGFPSFGGPHGYGLMQIDPPGSDQQIWDWTANRTEGIVRLNAKFNEGALFPATVRGQALQKKLPPAYLNARDFESEEELWKEAFQLYNGKHNWRWVPIGRRNDPQSGGRWVQRTDNSGYGIDAWNVLTDVRNGNPPPGWN